MLNWIRRTERLVFEWGIVRSIVVRCVANKRQDLGLWRVGDISRFQRLHERRYALFLLPQGKDVFSHILVRIPEDVMQLVAHPVTQ